MIASAPKGIGVYCIFLTLQQTLRCRGISTYETKGQIEEGGFLAHRIAIEGAKMGRKSGPVKGMPQPLPLNDKGHLLPDF
jgi:hypothetical protein